MASSGINGVKAGYFYKQGEDLDLHNISLYMYRSIIHVCILRKILYYVLRNKESLISLSSYGYSYGYRYGTSVLLQYMQNASGRSNRPYILACYRCHCAELEEEVFYHGWQYLELL